MKKSSKWEPPPPLGVPPRDPHAAMINLNPWWVFTVDGVPRLFKKVRFSWPNQFTMRKTFIGYDWRDCGPTDQDHPDCDCIQQIRELVYEHQHGMTV